MRDMKCKLDRCTVHYEIRGEGKPFIMLHGGGPDRRSMIGCIARAKRRGHIRLLANPV
jgi:hypothetical protein